MGYLSMKILMKIFFQNSKIFTSKMGRVRNEKKIHNIICPLFLEKRISTAIQTILKCMTYPKFGATFFDLGLQLPRQILNFKIQKFLWKTLIRLSKKNSPKKFWILKFFGLRQNLTRQLQAQIKKGYSKFWICHTFKNFLNCGTNSTFKKRWADDVLNFFFISHSTHF